MSEYIDKNKAVDEGYLADWYIHSVAEYANEKRNEPRWTEKHIKELARDFIVIPKAQHAWYSMVRYRKPYPQDKGESACRLTKKRS